jgi:hypothetical protein
MTPCPRRDAEKSADRPSAIVWYMSTRGRASRGRTTSARTELRRDHQPRGPARRRLVVNVGVLAREQEPHQLDTAVLKHENTPTSPLVALVHLDVLAR